MLKQGGGVVKMGGGVYKTGGFFGTKRGFFGTKRGVFCYKSGCFLVQTMSQTTPATRPLLPLSSLAGGLLRYMAAIQSDQQWLTGWCAPGEVMYLHRPA